MRLERDSEGILKKWATLKAENYSLFEGKLSAYGERDNVCNAVSILVWFTSEVCKTIRVGVNFLEKKSFLY